MLAIGRMTKYVALQTKGEPTVTTAGTVDQWDTYDEVFAAVEPVSPATLERLVGATVETPVTHLVTIWYRQRRAAATDAPGPEGKISVSDRVVYDGRHLYIGGMFDLRENHRQLVLACEERLN